MAYSKQNFTDGSVLTAEQLNNIEDGLIALEETVENLPKDPGTSTSNLLVTCDGSMADYTGLQISEHVSSGGTATLFAEGEYYAFQYAMDGEVIFTNADAQAGVVVAWVIHSDGTAEFHDRPIGPGALIVTISPEDETHGTASHTSQEIYMHAQAGGTVYLEAMAGYYYTLLSCAGYGARFIYISAEENFIEEIYIYDDGTYEIYTRSYVDTEMLDITVGNIETVLDAIIGGDV